MPIISLNLSIQNYSSLDGEHYFILFSKILWGLKIGGFFQTSTANLLKFALRQKFVQNKKLLGCNYSPKEDTDLEYLKRVRTCEASAAVLFLLSPAFFMSIKWLSFVKR